MNLCLSNTKNTLNIIFDWKKISAAVDKPFMSDDMIYFLLDMLKIETADFDSTLSPLEESYKIDRPRIFSGKNYDKEHGLQ